MKIVRSKACETSVVSRSEEVNSVFIGTKNISIANNTGMLFLEKISIVLKIKPIIKEYNTTPKIPAWA